MKRQINFWFICRFTMLCIILEERRKMRKKILDAALLFAFALCLIVTSNIQEEAAYVAELENEAVPLQNQEAEPEEMQFSAGVAAAISANSFTTESDEKTGIEKKESMIVTSAYDDDLMQEKIRTTKETQMEETAQAVQETPAEQNAQTVQEAPAEQDAQIVQETQAAPATPENRWHITLSPDETELLARIVWLESQGEPVKGQQAVVEVVFNRMRSDVYPDTLYEVLSQKNPVQFCSFKNRDRAKPTQKEYDSIQQVLDGKTRILRDDTMYFSTFPLTEHVEVKIGGLSLIHI